MTQSTTPAAGWQFQYPMGLPDRIPGDGCHVQHGYAVENATYYPGHWHTGENWYVQGADSAGALVYAVAPGEVVFAGYDYPGPVVLIRHTDDLYSQYGHLDYELQVEVGQQVQRGDVLGTVLYREDMRSHLHFELRTFYTTPEVNGDTPRYDFHCGLNCPPGPGYWPMDAPEHPSSMGWRNPLHVITWRMAGNTVMVPANVRDPLLLFDSLEATVRSGSVRYPQGTELPLLDVWAGEEASTATGVAATSIWYQVQLPERVAPAWVPAIHPTMAAIQGDGQPASFAFSLIPAVR